MLEIVSGINDTDGAGARAHDYRLGGRAAAKKMNPLEVVAVWHSRRRKHHMPGCKVLDENLFFNIFDTLFFAPLNFPVVSRLQTPLHIPPDAAQRSSRKTSFRPPADTHQEIDTG